VAWQELEDALHQLTGQAAVESAAAASQRQGQEQAVRGLEARLAAARADLAQAREELSAAEQGSAAARAELEAAQQHCAALRAQLEEEQGRASRLRGELAALSGSHIKEQKERSGLLADTLARLQVRKGGGHRVLGRWLRTPRIDHANKCCSGAESVCMWVQAEEAAKLAAVQEMRGLRRRVDDLEVRQAVSVFRLV
jgi:DNA repair exonuclease SbcCD ATPase subunit